VTNATSEAVAAGSRAVTESRFANGAALVVGGSGGLGGAICRRLAAAGSQVAIGYRQNVSRAEDLAATIQASGVRASAHAIELGDSAALSAACADAARIHDGIHTVVFASGPPVRLSPVAEMPREDWENSIAADATGFFNLIQATLPLLRMSRGTLVALSTAATQRYAPLDILSAGPKASVEQLVKAVAREEGRHGVRANGVRVGYIEAGLGLALQSDPRGQRLAERIRASTPLRRLGTAEDVANVVLFFASDQSAYVSGEFLCVDGGGHV
jgi:3-oxoacyl-[acyl-carrier protein] reductase